MDPREHRANDDGYELDGRDVVGRDTPAHAELARMRQIVHELRNPVGSVSMAIEMVLGPLRGAVDSLEPDLARRVTGTLEALSESSRQLRHLVSDLGGLASGALEVPVAPHEPAPATGASTRPAVESAALGPAPRPKASLLDVGDMLRRLEILTVTRSTIPALLAVDHEPELFIEANGPELLRALSCLVDNGVRAASQHEGGAGPWTVDVRAYARDGKVHIEVHNTGAPLPSPIVAWLSARADNPEATPPGGSKQGLALVGRVVEAFEGAFEGRSAAEVTVMGISFPAKAAPALEDDPAMASQ